MKRKNVKALLKLFDILNDHYTEEAFLVATYIYTKYNYKIFEENVDDEKLEHINEEIKKSKSLFDEVLVKKIDEIIKN